MNLHLVNLINDKIGAIFMFFITISFPEQDGIPVMSVICKPSSSEVFLKEGNDQNFMYEQDKQLLN